MENSRQFRLGVLGSGVGSTYEEIADFCGRPGSRMEVAVVLSDVENSGILAKAEAMGTPAFYVDPGRFRTKLDERAEASFIEILLNHSTDLVVLAGFMRILKGDFLRAFSDRVVNIHPSLLPAFPGLDAWKQALRYGVRLAGCTVHLVDFGVDTGPILAQKSVPVLDGDTEDTLRARIQEAEKRIYPVAIRDYLDGDLRPLPR